MKKNIKTLLIILGVIIVLVIGIKVFYLKYKTQTIQTKVTSTQETSYEVFDWKTYENTKFGVSIKYPPDWKVVMHGLGDSVEATNQAEDFAIVKNDETEGVYFDILTISSDRWDVSYPSIKNLSQYLNSIPNTDADGKVIRKFVKIANNVAGQEVYWYTIYEWSIHEQRMNWGSQLYWQHGNDIYEVSTDVSKDFLNKILSTFKYTK